jgi:dephospho-CoA kinase
MLLAPVPYQASWADDFDSVQASLAAAFSGNALGIDHVGSTAVVGLTAKPVIDVQVTVQSLACVPQLVDCLVTAGFSFRPDIQEDRPPPWEPDAPAQWRKAYFKSVDDATVRSQVHVRQAGCRNQRYALLFRDYLRANDNARDAYGACKLEIARHVGHLSRPGGTGPYLDTKDPVFDLIADAAEQWATVTGWQAKRYPNQTVR